MRFEQLIQILVPLMFLAIWALTSLFNRDAQPLPPRAGAGREPGPDDRSPGGPRFEGERPRERVAGATTGGPSAAERRPGLRSPEEAVVVVDGEARRPSSPARPAGTSARRSGRGRTASPTPIRPSEPVVTRSLTAEMSRSHRPLTDSHEALKSMATPRKPLVGTEHGLKAAIEARTTVETAPRPASVMGDRPLGLSSERLREAFILAEVLFKPPLSVRRPLPTPARGVHPGGSPVQAAAIGAAAPAHAAQGRRREPTRPVGQTSACRSTPTSGAAG
jgi:hypothetical protein